MRSVDIEVSQNGNLLMYKPGYTAAFVRQAIEANGLEGLRIWTDPLDEPPQDLTFLREFSFLQVLDVTSVYDYEFNFLDKLSSLRKLSINIEGRREIDLSNQTGLESLVLQWRKGKIKNIERCTKLRYLSLIGFNEIDLFPIQQLQTVTQLRIKTGSLKTLAGIERLVELQDVLLGNCRSLGAVKEINGLNKLESFEVDTCPKIEDWASLTDLPSVKYLRITNCRNVKSLKFLKKLPSLQKIVLNGNTTVEDGDLTLAKAIPNHWL